MAEQTTHKKRQQESSRERQKCQTHFPQLEPESEQITANIDYTSVALCQRVTPNCFQWTVAVLNWC